MKYPKELLITKARDKLTQEEQLTELKCFLRQPMESDLQKLISEFNLLITTGTTEVKVLEQESVVEQAQSLEDWFNELV